MSDPRFPSKYFNRIDALLQQGSETVKKYPAAWFFVLSSLSLLVYWIGLIRPYGLLSNYQEPLLDIGKLTQHQPLAQLHLGLTFVTLFALYYLIWRLCRNATVQRRKLLLVLWVSVFLINLAMLWLYPVGAADIFDYIMRGRITAHYGGNPFYDTPSMFSQDTLYQYVGWKKFTTAYGPLWELLSALASKFAGDGILANVLTFKVLGIILYLGCIKLIASILERHAPGRMLQGLCLFALNPLVIFETAGNGHNDIFVTFFILLALSTLLQKHFTLSALSLTAGALVKFIPILLLPIAVVMGFHAQPTKRQRWRFILITIAACGLFFIAFNGPFWQGGDPFRLIRRSGLFTTSLPAFVQARLELTLGETQSEGIVALAAFVLTAIFTLFLTWRAWIAFRKVELDPSRSDTDLKPAWVLPVQMWGWQLMFYLLFTCLWFQPWYVIWPMGLAALLPEGSLGRLVVLLSGLASFKTLLFILLLPSDGTLPPKSWRESILGPVILGLGWVYTSYLVARNLWKRRTLARQKPTGV